MNGTEQKSRSYKDYRSNTALWKCIRARRSYRSATKRLPLIKPHGRQSWMRSVQRTKSNETTVEKNQYLETIFRLSHQKHFNPSSMFDRIRFRDDPSTQTQEDISHPQPSFAAFLIENCPNEILSQEPANSTVDVDQQELSFIDEVELSHVEQRKTSKRRRRPKKKDKIVEELPPPVSTLQAEELEESTSSISLQTDQMQRRIETLQHLLASMTDDNRETHLLYFLRQIQEQQRNLSRFQQMLTNFIHNPSKGYLNKIRKRNLHVNQDLLNALFNPLTSCKECWLCIGRSHKESSTQSIDIVD